MALTREFMTTIKKRADQDPQFRIGMLQDAAEAFLTGEPDLGRLLLRDYVKATIGFEGLAKGLGDINPTSLMRMLSAKGNPSSKNLSAIMAFLQEHEGVSFDVVSRSVSSRKRKLGKA
ncbi:DNA-binding protein [Novipirellula sp. SH528]|uniref:helix-turn-helix domain-containing transcriptional regulator n=1 Tax=Novipirellula sp. SH528 TaxID=3454466 RepID=UPI003FA0DA94